MPTPSYCVAVFLLVSSNRSAFQISTTMANETDIPQSDSSEQALTLESKLKELELQLEKQRQTFGKYHANTQEAEHDLFLEYQFAG
jgi:hypothetical protein